MVVFEVVSCHVTTIETITVVTYHTPSQCGECIDCPLLHINEACSLIIPEIPGSDSAGQKKMCESYAIMTPDR